MTKHDACELAYKNGYEACRTDMMNTVNALEGKYNNLWAYTQECGKQIAKLKAERDAAVADIETMAKHSDDPCYWCANYLDVKLTRCMMCDDEEYNGNFEWRGLSLAEKTSDKEVKE